MTTEKAPTAQAQPGGAPQMTMGGVPLQKAETIGTRLMRHVASDLADKIAKDLPPGMGVALILTDAGFEGLWAVQERGQGNMLNTAALWLQSQGVQFGPQAVPDKDETPPAKKDPDAPAGTGE